MGNTYFNYLIIYHAQVKPYQTAIGNMQLKRTNKIETFEDAKDVKNFIESETNFENVVILNIVELASTVESGENDGCEQ